METIIMRVFFTPSGTGLGHVGRCIPIAKLLEEDGAQILFSTYREGLKYVQREGFNVVEAPDIGVAVKPDGSTWDPLRQGLCQSGIWEPGKIRNR